MKIGRNERCPCGSGQKYKRCCGTGEKQPWIKPIDLPPAVRFEILKRDAIHKARKRAYGDGKEIISADNNGIRFVAVGNKVTWSEKWQVFPDFLTSYLADCMNISWGNAQLKLPIEQRHPVPAYYGMMCLDQKSIIHNDKKVVTSNTGATNAWFRIAYDLYLIDHNADLKNRLLRRIRDTTTFQAARFEAAVAAMMVVSGYELRFSDEKGPGKHPEFWATNRDTGHVVAIEAKSRHRPGIMGFEAGVSAQPPASFGIDGLLFDAVAKDTAEPLIVFIELNTPTILDPSADDSGLLELRQAWERVQAMDWLNGFPAVGVVFYNDVCPWFLREPLPDGGQFIWGFVMWAKSHRHSFDAIPLLKRIGDGCVQRGTVPHDFPPDR